MRIFMVILLSMSAQGACHVQAKGSKKIVIFGAGYVGTVSGACLAKCGHKVTLIEPDKDKVDTLHKKKSPIFEPKLEELVCQGIERASLEVKSALGDEILDADVAIIAVATPTTEEGVVQLSCLESVLDQLYEATKKRKRRLVVSIRSTILPMAFEQLANNYLQKNAVFSLVVNPEFLRESSAVDDFFNPPFCVAGGDDLTAVEMVLSLYEDICPKRFAVSGKTACLLKYACNAFHAAKIVFTNEITTLCDSLGINPVELMGIFSEDKILNSSSAYFKPGFSFGGPCLAKDLRALIALGNDLGDSLPLLSSIMSSNQCRFQKIVHEILQRKHRFLAILGVSFKQHSDDLRESPFVELIKRLKQAAITLRIFDPDVQFERLTNVNREIFMQCSVDCISLLSPDLSSALAGCDGVVVCKDLLDESSLQQLKKTGIPIYNLGYFSLKGDY